MTDSPATENRATERPVSESPSPERIEVLEQHIADVDRALSTLEELHAESKGRGGSEAADRIRAVVSAERFPAEPQLPEEPQLPASPERSEPQFPAQSRGPAES